MQNIIVRAHERRQPVDNPRPSRDPAGPPAPPPSPVISLAEFWKRVDP